MAGPSRRHAAPRLEGWELLSSCQQETPFSDDGKPEDSAAADLDHMEPGTWASGGTCAKGRRPVNLPASGSPPECFRSHGAAPSGAENTACRGSPRGRGGFCAAGPDLRLPPEAAPQGQELAVVLQPWPARATHEQKSPRDREQEGSHCSHPTRGPGWPVDTGRSETSAV